MTHTLSDALNAQNDASQGATIYMLAIKEVLKKFSFSKSTLYQLIADGQFPRGYKVAPKAVRWRSDELDAHLTRLTHSFSGN